MSTACLLLAWLLTVPVHWAVVTDGFRQSLLEPDGPSQYFDAYADSLRSGRLNVDPYHIGNEAFLVKDRAYGYFGLTPALLRMPLNAAFPSLWGHWARIMMLLGAALSVLGAHWLAICAYGPEPALLSFERRAAHVVYLLIVGLGSTALFLPSRPNVFHEASALGVGLTLAGLGALATWQRRPTLSRALFAALLAVLALHARIVCGAAVVMAAGIVVVLASWRICVRKQRSEPVAQVVVLAVGGLMAAGSYAALNWMKFGTLLSIPIELNLQSSPARLARTGGHMMRLNNVAANAYNYLAPWNVKLGGEGALVQPIAPENLLITPGMDYDWREPVISLWAASPALLTVSLLGLCVLFVAARRKQPASLLVPALIGGAASVTSPLLYFAITQRYSHDMLPFLVVSAALAMGATKHLSLYGLRACLGVLLAATTWSVFAWWDVGVVYRVWAADVRISPIRDDIVVPAYERELREHPNNVTLHSELGYIHSESGRTQQARAHLERAIALDPNHLPSLVLLAALRRASDPSGAIDLLMRAARAAPESAQIHGMLGAVLFSAGRTQEAVGQLRLATQLDPGDGIARGWLEHALAH